MKCKKSKVFFLLIFLSAIFFPVHSDIVIATEGYSTSKITIDAADFVYSQNVTIYNPDIIMGGGIYGPSGDSSSCKWIFELGSTVEFDRISFIFEWGDFSGKGLKSTSESEVNISVGASETFSKTINPIIYDETYGWYYHPPEVSSLTMNFNCNESISVSEVEISANLSEGCVWDISYITMITLNEGPDTNFGYGAFRGAGPSGGETISSTNVQEDMQILSDMGISSIRTYGSGLNQDIIAGIAHQNNIGILQGIFSEKQ